MYAIYWFYQDTFCIGVLLYTPEETFIVKKYIILKLIIMNRGYTVFTYINMLNGHSVSVM